MADTLGSLVDKLCTIDLKMWQNQEVLYDIRRMTFEEYKAKYFDTKEGAKDLWDRLRKSCDLNVQRNQLIDEIDKKVVEIVSADSNQEDLDNGKFIQRKHKTY